MKIKKFLRVSMATILLGTMVGGLGMFAACTPSEPEPEIPNSETPGGETPGGETPGGETPGGETPGGETPGGETPGGETPGGETPVVIEQPEWAKGNEQIKVTMNFDVANSDCSYWAFTQADSDWHILKSHPGLTQLGMWTKDSYVGLKPMLYEAAYIDIFENPSIHLGYYDGNFDIACNSATKTATQNLDIHDYTTITYTFTDTATGEYFTAKQVTQVYTNGGTHILYLTNGQTGAEISDKNLQAGTADKTNGHLYPNFLRYDTEKNRIVTNREGARVLNLADIGLTKAFDTYKVDVSFSGWNTEKKADEDLLARLMIYYLNGYDLTEDTDADNLTSNGMVVYKKAAVYSGTDVTLSDMVGVWDPAKGDVSEEVTYTVTDSQGAAVTVTDGKFVAVASEKYTVSVTYGETTKSLIISDTVIPDTEDPGTEDPGTETPEVAERLEWAKGNDNVNVTMNYDITNSAYGASGTGFAITETDNTALTAYNDALKAEGFWYKDSYLNLKPMLYETVANAADTSINLGYYGGDFGISFTSVQSLAVNNTSGPHDYLGVEFTFTNTVTGDTFAWQMANAKSSRNYLTLKLFVNGEFINENGFYFAKYADYSFTGHGSNSILNLMNFKYDQDENVIKYGPGLQYKTNPLSAIPAEVYPNCALEAFEQYTVTMKFMNVTADKTAKLCVYYLNGYDLTETTDADNLTSKGTVVYQKAATYSGANVTLADIAGAWDTAKGDVSAEVTYTVTDAQGAAVTVTDGKFVAAASGEYTVSVTYGTTTKSFTVTVTV